MERELGEMQLKKHERKLQGKILPPIMHPESRSEVYDDSQKTSLIQRRLKNEQVRSDVGHASKEPGNGKIEKACSDEGDTYDKWVDQSKNKGQRRGSQQPATTHLDGLKWEAIVVDKPDVNALHLHGGKIVVFTGLLQHFSSNAETATIIGHGVAHVVARHGAKDLTKKLRMEMEADYIGLLRIAFAGFDLRMAPKVYERLGRVNGESTLRDYLFTHPSGKKKAELLSQAKVMDEALTVYKDERAPDGVFKVFFLLGQRNHYPKLQGACS